jgi:hypothetical protein
LITGLAKGGRIRVINNVADANWRARRLGWLCVVEEDMLRITLVEADKYPAGTPALAA